jgi:hypothetical protein
MLKAVLDTNQFISGLIVKEGVPAQVLDAWHRGVFTLLTSSAILAEAREVFSYPRIRKKYRISQQDIDDFLAQVEKGAVMTPGRLALSVVEEDPDDDIILACAVEGGADYIVSGDPHLLKLRSYEAVPIVTPRDFLTRLSQGV